jgi:lysophospholipase
VQRLPNGRLLLLEGARHEIMMESDAILNRFWSAVDRMTVTDRADLQTAVGL